MKGECKKEREDETEK